MYSSEELAVLQSVGGKSVSSGSGDPTWNFGWVPPTDRSEMQRAMHDAVMATTPRLEISGQWKEQRRVALWQAGPKLFGRFLRYNWQLTGSCVGAGGDNCRKTIMAVEIAIGGEAEEFKDVWWPYTYGKSRERAGMRSPGEGSMGSTWADAATQDGCFALDEDSSLPQFKEVEGWLQLTEQTEIKWSDGDAIPSKYNEMAKSHLFKAKSQCRDHSDVKSAITNGYACTQASSFGFNPMVPRPQGDPPVRLVTWNGRWNHQTYFDEVWDHPSLGLIFRWGNNWGPKAHGPALADEPPSSVYVSAKTVDEICQGNEVFSFSMLDGFPAREIKLDWTP